MKHLPFVDSVLFLNIANSVKQQNAMKTIFLYRFTKKKEIIMKPDN